MVRSMLLSGAAVVLAGLAGCSSCDTCDDFPAPCTTGNCGYGTTAMAGPAMMGPISGGMPMASQPIAGTGQITGPVGAAAAGSSKPTDSESVSPPSAPPATGLTPFEK